MVCLESSVRPAFGGISGTESDERRAPLGWQHCLRSSCWVRVLGVRSSGQRERRCGMRPSESNRKVTTDPRFEAIGPADTRRGTALARALGEVLQA
jgi:hypothetical protein